MDKISSKRRGFAFLRFPSVEKAEKAMDITQRRSRVQISRYKQSSTSATVTKVSAEPGGLKPNPWSGKSAWNNGGTGDKGFSIMRKIVVGL